MLAPTKGLASAAGAASMDAPAFLAPCTTPGQFDVGASSSAITGAETFRTLGNRHVLAAGNAAAATAVFLWSRVLVRRRGRGRGGVAACRARGGQASHAGETTGARPDLFLQLPFNNGVMLSGLLSGNARLPLLPPAQELPRLAIVPVGGSEAKCVPFDAGLESQATKALKRRLAPGPLRPVTPAGRALKWALQAAPEDFPRLRDYEIMRTALSTGRPHVLEQAEVLLLSVYAEFQACMGAPPRPSVSNASNFDEYACAFSGVAMKALESTTSPDFQLIAKAHVLGLVQNVEFPRLPVREARAMYNNSMRFGHALRQAETRFLADGAAGTFVPLPLEAELLREELEAAWSQSDLDGDRGVATTSPATSGVPRRGAEVESLALSVAHGLKGRCESDAEAAQRGLREVLKRLQRIGEARPGLATYLGWLGRFDPQALSFLATPTPLLAQAMRMQVASVWGTSGDDVPDTVATTPSDMIEAVLLGAWLRDAAIATEEAMARHRQFGRDSQSVEV